MINATDAKRIRQLLRHLAENPATEETIIFFADTRGMLQSCDDILTRYHDGNREIREWVDRECANQGISPAFLLQEAARIRQIFGGDARENLDSYQALGLSAATATPETIKRAYRRLCAQYHPDTTTVPGPATTEKFIAINRAYQALMAEASDTGSKPAETTASSWHHGRQRPIVPRNSSKIVTLAGIIALVAVGLSMLLAHLHSQQAMRAALRHQSEAFVPPSERSAPAKDPSAPLTLYEKLQMGAMTIPEEPPVQESEPPSKPLPAETPAPIAATVKRLDDAQTNGTIIAAGTTEPVMAAHKEKPVALLTTDQHKIKTETANTAITPTPLPANVAEQGENTKTVATATPSAVGKDIPATSMERESPPPSTLRQRLDDFLLDYCRAYGAQDLEAFSRFFDLAAIENGQPFLELRDTYRHLFVSTRERSLIISSRQWEKTGDNVRLQGRFTITLIYDNGETINRDGSIEFLLADGQGGLLIKALNYSFEDHSKQTEPATMTVPSAVGKKLSDQTLPKQESLPASSLQQQLDDFLDAYCNAYGAQDLEAFSRFFDLAATENDKPFLELRDTYRRLFASTRERTLVISSRQWKEEGNHIHLHGQFTITLIYDNEETVHGAGSIEFLLTNNRDNLQIKTMNYSFKKQ